MNHLDPKAFWLFFIQSFISVGMTIIVIVAWIAPTFLGLGEFIGDGVGSELHVITSIHFIVIAVLLAIVFALLWSHLIYRNYRYEFTDLGFKKEEGVIIKKYITIPYERIQNVDIYRGIVARILGLSDLQIQTAGMSAPTGKYGMAGTEGRLIGLSHAVAEQIRDELIQRSRGTKGPGM